MARRRSTMSQQAPQSPFRKPDLRGGEGVLKLAESRRKNSEENRFFTFGGYWFTTVFALRGRAFPFMPLFWYMVYSSAVVAIVLYAISDPENNVYLSELSNVQVEIGALLGLLLAFRYQQGYDRWMEGRNAWEVVSTACYSLARYSQVYVKDKAKAQKLVAYAAMFPWALKLHLQQSKDLQGYGDVSPADVQDITNSRCMPLCILRKMSALVNEMDVEEDAKLFLLECQIDQLADALDTVRTISSMPSPFAYIAHLRCIMIGFLLFFPFIFAPTMRWYCLIVCAFVGFAWLGVESVTLEIESPFGVDYNDLPLNAYNNEILSCMSVWPDVAPTHCPEKVVSTPIKET